jgi:class 3 adenylate cyclase
MGMQQVNEASSTLANDGAKRPPTILVIEDNDNLRELLGHQLRFFKLEPVCMQNGLDGLRWLEEHKPDLVVLDWMLPDMDGIEVLEVIRKRYSQSALPVLMLSALGKEVDRRVTGLKAGANDFMAKPYEVSELVARIQGHLAVKDEAEQAGQAEDVLAGYASKLVRDQVRLDPEAINRRELRDAVVMFADLRGFTALSASLQTESTVDVLDVFFDTMMEVVSRYNGCVLDLAGDEMLVTFSIPEEDPNAVEHALNAAAEMQAHFEELREMWAQAGIKVGLGIGIHHGEVMLGNMGGRELRRYTVIGNAVNVAHRLVEIAGEGEIIISPDVFERAASMVVELSPERMAANLKGVDAVKHVYRIRSQHSEAAQGDGGLLGKVYKLLK